MDTTTRPLPSAEGPPALTDLLHAAVTAVGGVERDGQVTMAQAVKEAVDGQSHLLVQAGTGTGKSLGYLVPALAHGERVVVATATLALQRQLVERDLPRTVEALKPLLRREPQFAMLKGRSNYLCLHRLHEGVPQDEEDGLFDPFEAAAPTSKLGKDLLRLRDWADETETGDRDGLTPGVSDRAWSQVSVTSRECLGATKCAYGAECFAEAARERAKLADVVVTNHALLAIDAIEGAPVLPGHEVLIVDEGHELVSRVTGVATGELTPIGVNRAVKRAAKLVNEKAADALLSASEGFERVMELALPGRLVEIPEDLGYVLAALRDACRQVITALGETRDKSVQDEDAVRKQALASVEHVHEVAERLVQGSEYDVVWCERHDRFGASLRVAPLSVSGLLREKLFTERSVVLTSATLKLGDDFNGVAASLGLSAEGIEAAEGEDEVPQWKGLDVGSPFDYRKQGILYVARHLSQPGRDSRPGGHARRTRRADRGGRRPHPRPVLLDAGRPGRGGGHARAPGASGAPPGRGDARGADPHLLAGPADLPVRHAVAVAGRRCAGGELPVGGDGPHSLPPPRRPADERAAEVGGGARRQRLHGGRRHPCRAADGAGRRAADPGHRRPGCGGRAGPEAGHGPLRGLPAVIDAGPVVHHGPQPGAEVAGRDRCGGEGLSAPASRRRGANGPRTSLTWA